MSSFILHLPGQRACLWLICAFVALLTLATRTSITQGATAGLMPDPIHLPLPEGLIYSDNFGAAIDVDGDVVVVGAPNTDVNGNENQGVVYIYTRDADNPAAYTLLKSISGSGGMPHDEFGSSVELEGNTLVVGTLTVSNDSAYVFARNEGGENNWGETQRLLRGDDREVTYFGQTVAMHGDTILVGAPLGKGEVFVFTRDPGVSDQWTRTQILTPSLPVTLTAPLSNFGAEIEFDGERIVVAAMGLGLKSVDIPPGEPTPKNNTVGAVYVFAQQNGEWTIEAKLFSSDIALGVEDIHDDRFGRRIALQGDTLFVSAPSGLFNGVDPGKVFVFQKGSGTTPILGQPGGWGEVAQLGPSDGVYGDQFGIALYPVEEGLFVAAHRWGVGKVYFFSNPASSASSVAPHAPHAWQEVYGYTPSEDGTNTAFGVPIVGDGDLIFFGDQYADGLRGGVNIYPQDALLAYDPNATPPPSETPTTMPPAEPGPCVSSLPAQPTPETPTPEIPTPETPTPETPTPDVPTQGERQLYLPNIVGNATPASGTPAPNVVAVATPVVASALFTGVLDSDCLLVTSDRVILAAVAGAITQTVRISIETTAAPPEALPDGTTPLGSFVRIASERNELTTMLTPLIIGLPVPAGADTAHLSLLTLLPPTSTLDNEVPEDETENVWSYLPGVYDATHNLFLARLPFLLADGTTLRLVEHPDFDSPPNAPEAQVASPTLRGEFEVYCIRSTFARSSACSEITADRAKEMLDEIYQRMVDDTIFGYPRELRLLDAASQIIVSEAITITPLTASYAAYLMGPKDPSCKDADGYYIPETGFMALCLDATQSMGEEEKKSWIHELFHAIEYTYPKVLNNRLAKKDEPWIIEGMAEAAVESFPEDDKMQRSSHFGVDNLKKIDKPLTEGRWKDKPIDEYLAQDFWVYLGQSEEENLAYLRTVLDLGGARAISLDPAMQTLFGKSLSEVYWGWVKNQAIENQYDVGAGQEIVCELQEEALSSGEPVLFFAAENVYPYETGIAFDRLPPRTAKVIEINFGDRTGGIVTVEYEGCSHLEEPTAKASCDATAQNSLRAKMVEEHELSCEATNLPGYIREGQRRFNNVLPDTRYFVVVANLDPWATKGFSITIE